MHFRTFLAYTRQGMLVFGTSVGLVTCVGTVAQVSGPSMSPTFNPRGYNQDKVWVDKWSARVGKNFRPGDVLVLISPENPRKLIVKRLIALPGDEVTSKAGVSMMIAPGHCWVEGDNYTQSKDSNTWGQLPQGLIAGRVPMILWPPSRVGVVHRSIPYRTRDRIRRSSTGDDDDDDDDDDDQAADSK